MTLNTMNKLITILVGSEFSDCSRSAVQLAVCLVKRSNARLNALHGLECLTLSDTAPTA